MIRTRQPSASLREEVRGRRGDAWSAFFRVELLSANEVISDKARVCMEQIRELKNIHELTLLDREAENARQSIHDFVRTARDDLLAG